MSKDAMPAATIDLDALSDAPMGDAEWAKLEKVVNVKRLRERLGLTQEAFAATYRIPLGTLRDWEQRRKHPDAPARAYLLVIARDPEKVAGLLAAA